MSVSDDLYSQLSKRKPYAELTKLLWKYQDAVSYIDIALEDENWMNKAKDLFTPRELKVIKTRYDTAMNVIRRSLEGDKHATGFLEELFQASKEPLKQGLAETIEFVKSHQGDSRLL